MGDYISRRAAIKTALEYMVEFCGAAFDEEMQKGILNRLEGIPSANVQENGQGQWILCKDRLPFAEYGESEKMLTTCTHRNRSDWDCRWIECLYFNGGVWCYPTGEPYEYGQVIAWMPLPAPYEGR